MPLIADVSGDGKLDLLVTAISASQVNVFLGNGNGTFTTGASLTSASTHIGLPSLT